MSGTSIIAKIFIPLRLQSLMPPVIILAASKWIESSCLFASLERLSQTESLYSCMRYECDVRFSRPKT